MKVVYYSKYSDKGPSSRYRAFQFVDCFRKAGVDYTIENLFDDAYFDLLRKPESFQRKMQKIKYVVSRFRNRKNNLRGEADLFIIEGQLFPYMPFALERRYLPAKYLIEFDDAIYLTHPFKFPDVIKRARAVLAGNQTLADYAGRYNEHIHLVPTVVNTDLFSPLPKPQSEKIRIGWSGIEYNFKYIRSLTPVLWKLSQKYSVEFVILSGTPPRNLTVPFRFVKWEGASEAEQINEFDIGIMPLQMDEWCKGKCAIKLLQYMSLSIPSVATPVGVNADIIEDEKNGFTAVGLEQWEQALSRLIEDASLRERLGKKARETVVEKFSVKVWFPRLLEIYKNYSQ